MPGQSCKTGSTLGIKKTKTSQESVLVQLPSRSTSTAIVTETTTKEDNLHIKTTTLLSSQSYQYTGKIDNIDEKDQNDPLCVTEYVEEMYMLFREQEKITSVRPLYMINQPQIDSTMREILVDWLVTVHTQFKLVPETLYLAVNIIDRYLERKEVARSKVQLVGVTALFIASKYEEIYAPCIRDMVHICDNIYPHHEIVAMETQILTALEFKVTVPTAHTFLVRFLKAAHADKSMSQMACYILEGTLQSYDLLHYLPSQLASAAVLIARMSSGRNEWSPTLLKYTEYKEEDISPVANDVLKKKSLRSHDLRAVTKKYSSRRYGGVAKIPLW